MASGKPALHWDFDIPLLDPLILQGLAKALGIPFVLLSGIILYVAMKSGTTFNDFMRINGDGLFFAAILIGITILLTALFLAIVYHGRYSASFTLDEEGAAFSTRPDQQKLNNRINSLLFWGGLLLGKPGYTGTGLLARASQSGGVSWDEICRVTPYPRRHTIVLHDSWHKALILYCTPANYAEVLTYTSAAVDAAAKRRILQPPPQRSYRRLCQIIALLILIPLLVFAGIKTYRHIFPPPKPRLTAEEMAAANRQLSQSLEASLLRTGNAEYLRGNFDKALENATAVLDVNPSSINAHLLRGNAYFGKQDYSKAIADYSAIIKADPRHAAAYYNRALAYQASGNQEASLADYKQAAAYGHEKAKEKLTN